MMNPPPQMPSLMSPATAAPPGQDPLTQEDQINLQLNMAITNLHAYGLPVATISTTLNISVSRVRIALGDKLVVIPTEDEIANSVRGLMHLAVLEGHRILKWGTPAAKHSLVRAMLGSLARSTGEDQDDREEMRDALTQLLAHQRAIDPPVDQ